MPHQDSDRLRPSTHHLLNEVIKSHQTSYQAPESTSPIFHNFPWLPTPPMKSPHIEPVELPGSIPAFELSGSSIPVQSNKIIYAEVWLTESPPPYSFLPPSPTLSARSVSSNESSSTMYSAKSHLSHSSQTSQTCPTSQASQKSVDSKKPRTLRSLRRKQAPQDTSLRRLRAKESEAELRKMYEQQTDEYMGKLFASLGSPIQRPLSVIKELESGGQLE